MSRTPRVLRNHRKGGGPVLALAQRKTSPASSRITAAQLMALRSHVGLPSLEGVTSEQCFLADDAEAIGLAKILVTSKIGVAEDREKSRSDPTKYLWFTLQRWVREHGGAAIDRRFDLDLAIGNRLFDYSEERAPRGTLYLIVDPIAAAFVLLNPDPRPPREGASAASLDILQSFCGSTQSVGACIGLPRRGRTRRYAALMVRS